MKAAPAALNGHAPPVLREPPHATEAEQQAIGACLIDPAAIAEVREEIAPGDCFYPMHAKILSAVFELERRGQMVDPVTVADALQTRGELEESGGAAYLTALAAQCSSTVAGGHYAKIVAEKSTLRRLIVIGEGIARHAHAGRESSADQIERASGALFALGQRRNGGRFEHVGPTADAAIEVLRERMKSPNIVTGAPTGLVDYDKRTGGLNPAEMTVWAARPGQGKTSLALQVSTHVATGGGAVGPRLFEPRPVAFISMEMSREQLMRRLFSQISGVSSTSIRTGHISQEQFERVETARLILRAARFYVDDTPGLNTSQMLSRLRRMHTEAGGIGLIVTDYLTLARVAKKTDSRAQDIAEICNDLCDFSKIFDCPMICLSQMSRAIEGRGKEAPPLLSDLRDSGAIEQAASVVGFIHRPGDAADPRVQIILKKDRYEQAGIVHLRFEAHLQRFACEDRHSVDPGGYHGT